MSIKDYVKSPALFVEYRKGNLWYSVVNEKDLSVLLFPVPIEDIGDGIFKYSEKGIFMMRYIRKHLEFILRGPLA